MNLASLNLLPRPQSCAVASGLFAIGSGTTVAESPEAAGAAAELRSLLCPATGFRLAPSGLDQQDVISLTVDPAERSLGDEGYHLLVSQ
jgi:hypothetical protein